MLGLVVKELDLTTLVSFFGERNYVVIACAIVGAAAWRTRLKSVVTAAAVSAALLWLAVGFTPLTAFMARDLVRRDPLTQGDAVFVLASSLQADSELTTSAMSRLLHGLELLGEGWAERLVLTELSEPVPRYREAACTIMDRLGLENEVIALGPVRNTHDEAVLVAELARDYGFERLLVVTSPSHSRRASAALEAEGVRVISSPSQQTRFDLQDLASPGTSDGRHRAFGPLLHEHAGNFYYRLRGWIE